MSQSTLERARPAEILRAQGRVLYALMLRDIRSRFFGSAIGFLFSIAWPLSHVLILVAINTAVGRVAPYGESAALWYATGVVPFMAFSYMARFTMLGVILNKNLLTLPAVTVTDILFARAILEVLSAATVVLILMAIFAFLGIDFRPIDVVQVGYGMLAAMLLGLGFGVLNGVIAGIYPFWITAIVLLQIVLWLTSGVIFIPDAFPIRIQHILALNPALDCVEWVRGGFYIGYGSVILNKSYVLFCGGGMLLFGLLLERFIRGRIMISN